MDCSTLGFPVHHQLLSLLKLMSIESVIPSNHLILCHPLLLLPSIFPSIRVFSSESVICIFTASDFTSIASHIHNWVLFALALSLHSFWSYFSTVGRTNIGHLPTWVVHLSVSYLFAFSYCSWGSQGKNTEVVCHSLLQQTTFCQNSPP